jgi:hypothetical protein
LWSYGIHVNVLVMIGVQADGRKVFLALADGYRASTEFCPDLLREAKV